MKKIGLGLVHVEHRHAVDRRALVGLGGRVDHVVGADDEGDVGLGELAVDVLQLEHFVIGHVGFGQQHVHVPGHAARDRVDRVFDADAVLLEHVAHLAQRMLRLGDRHAVAGNDDDAVGLLQQEGRVLGAAALPRAVGPGLAAAAAASAPKPPAITEMKLRFIARHMM